MIRAAISRSRGTAAQLIAFEEAAALIAVPAADPDQVVWIDVHAASDQELAGLEKLCGLHALTVEDLRHRNQRAKLEEYPGYLFMVLHWFRSPETTRNPEEVHVVLGRNYLLTVCDNGGIEPVEFAWTGFLRGRARPPWGADGELYRILDVLVDSHLPVLGAFEDRLERLSAAALDERMQSDIAEVMKARRALVRFRRALAPQRDVLSAIARREHSLISEKSLLYFRDVADHLLREYEAIESLRDLTQSVMEIHLAVNERQQNRVIQKLTVISAVFLPLNFVTGFFGMNFEHMPFGDDRFLLAAVAAMLALPTVMIYWFQRRHWI